MAKKNRIVDYDDDAVLDKKAKRRREKEREREMQLQQQRQEEISQQREAEPVDAGSEAMSKIALLAQEGRWREAVVFGRRTLEQAQQDGNEDSFLTLQVILPKFEMSLRRQMAAAFLDKAKEMLKKEYLLDVGE